MVRLLIDDFSNGHDDLFLKIDTWPSEIRIADSYFLSDFFQVRGGWDESRPPTEAEVMQFKRDMAVKLLLFWIELVETADDETYLPFDLSDQYVGAMHLKKAWTGYATTLKVTPKLYGCGEIADGFIGRARDGDANWQASTQFNIPAGEWIFSKQHLIEGFQWSIDRIRALP